MRDPAVVGTVVRLHRLGGMRPSVVSQSLSTHGTRLGRTCRPNGGTEQGSDDQACFRHGRPSAGGRVVADELRCRRCRETCVVNALNQDTGSVQRPSIHRSRVILCGKKHDHRLEWTNRTVITHRCTNWLISAWRASPLIITVACGAVIADRTATSPQSHLRCLPLVYPWLLTGWCFSRSRGTRRVRVRSARV